MELLSVEKLKKIENTIIVSKDITLTKNDISEVSSKLIFLSMLFYIVGLCLINQPDNLLGIILLGIPFGIINSFRLSLSMMEDKANIYAAIFLSSFGVGAMISIVYIFGITGLMFSSLSLDFNFNLVLSITVGILLTLNYFLLKYETKEELKIKEKQIKEKNESDISIFKKFISGIENIEEFEYYEILTEKNKLYELNKKIKTEKLKEVNTQGFDTIEEYKATMMKKINDNKLNIENT